VNQRLVVLGDTLLDRDVEGVVERFSPDAPVPVLDELETRDRPGGAGLAATLAAADGFEVTLVTALAGDDGGARLRQLLHDAGVRVCAVPLTGNTPEKIRLRSQGHTLLRLDRARAVGRVGAPSDQLLGELRSAGAILVSDYGRGLTSVPELRQALAGASAPVVWDPHPRGAPAVAGVRVVTPNEAEARRLAGGEADGPRLAAVTAAARRLRQQWEVDAVAVTMGGDGALLCHGDGTPLVVPASPAGPGVDTCGAGDRFAGALAGALVRGALLSEAVGAAVTAASAFVNVVPAPAQPSTVAEVRARGGTVVATGGCFDLLHAGHVATLQAARRLGDCLVVCLNSDASVRALKGPERPFTPVEDRRRLLAALDCVDEVVVFDELTPHAVLDRIRPDIWVKGGDYVGDEHTDLPESALIRRWGGQTVVVPYLAGRSTTRTAATVRSTK
jgi:D-beta-D-heptose 7-phosphate kinase / D-beta-D-heptose 1-phosphate adenosyltransferase